MIASVMSTEMLAIACPLGYELHPYHPRRANKSGRARSNSAFNDGLPAGTGPPPVPPTPGKKTGARATKQRLQRGVEKITPEPHDAEPHREMWLTAPPQPSTDQRDRRNQRDVRSEPWEHEHQRID